MSAPARPAPVGRAEQLTGWGFRAAWRLVRALPEAPVQVLANRLAARAVRRRGPAVVQYARNLRRVLRGTPDGTDPNPAELHRTVTAGLRSYARYWVETFRLPAMDLDDVAHRAYESTRGREHLQAAQAAGRGMIVALPHSGNWDVAGLMVVRNFGPMTTVAERLRPESLYDAFVAYRESLGFEILPLTGGPVPASQVLKDRLRAGGIVCLLADRDLTASGVPVEFFGETTRMPAGPAMLAALTGADLCPVHLTFTADGWDQVIHPPLPLRGERLAQQVRTGAQALADVFERDIASRPEDWHMLQPLWLADLPAARSRTYPAAATGAAFPATVTGSGNGQGVAAEPR